MLRQPAREPAGSHPGAAGSHAAAHVDSPPDAVVTGYEDRVEEHDLPDVDDRHVLAAAVDAGASLLVTDNLDDFPAKRISEGLRVVSPDEFVLELGKDDLDVVVDVVETQAAGLVNPPMTASELLDGLEAVGLVQAVAVLRPAIG